MSEYIAEIVEIDSSRQAAMRGVTWHAELEPLAFSELRLLRLRHWTFASQVATGELVVAAQLAEEIADILGLRKKN